MKTLQESILSSVGAGKASIVDYIKNTNYMRASFYNDFSNITFKDFLDCVDEQTMEKCLKTCFKDASKNDTMGRVTFCFKDGNLGVEIMSDLNRMEYAPFWLYRMILVINSARHLLSRRLLLKTKNSHWQPMCASEM